MSEEVWDEKEADTVIRCGLEDYESHEEAHSIARVAAFYRARLAAKEAELERSDRWKLRLKEALEAEVKINEQLVADHARFVSAVRELVEAMEENDSSEIAELGVAEPLARVKEHLKEK